MKKVLLALLLVSLIFSCHKREEPEIQDNTNKVVLLKVDFLTNAFEGGKELEFSEYLDFTISSTYQAPVDFGSVQLYYNELNEIIFDGTIIWMGTGVTAYPEEIDLPNTFFTTSDALPLPNLDLFENVMYDEFAYYPDTIAYLDIWNAIKNLEIVSNYRNSNPNGKINLFLYTPSVGGGNPAEWDWYIYLKN